MDNYAEYRGVFDLHSGVLKTSDFLEAGYHHKYLKELLDKGYIRKIKRGCYQWVHDDFVPEGTLINKLFPQAVTYLESALYVYDYIDDKPEAWQLAVERGSARAKFNIEEPKVKPFFIHEKFIDLGCTDGIFQGSVIKVFDRDRAICDLVRNQRKLDYRMGFHAIRKYIKDPKRDSYNLIKYAKELRIEKKIRSVMGMWL